jgi:DNA polymerase-1
MRRIWDDIRTEGLDAHLLLQVHDEVILEVRDEHLDKLVALVYTMLDGVMPIDFPVEPEVGKNWAQMTPYK